MQETFRDLLNGIGFLLAILVISGCGSGNRQKDHAAMEAADTAAVMDPAVPETQEDGMQQQEELVIRGKDIWVRDKAATGSVVMKLNDGNRCRILEKSDFEIIRGMPDFWYRIEYGGQEGWVFGSQTDLEYFDGLIGSADALWYAFCDAQISLCEKESEDFAQEVGTNGCRSSWLSDSSLRLIPSVEDFAQTTYTRKKIHFSDLVLVAEKDTSAGANTCRSYKTRIAFMKDGNWQMRAGEILDGKLATLHQLNDDMLLIITFSYRMCGPEPDIGFLGLYTETSWNVYLFDRKTDPAVSLKAELGKLGSWGDVSYSVEDGDSFTDSTSLEYYFDEDPLRLVLNEFKRKKQGEHYIRKPELTDRTAFTWDEKQMKFIEL